MGTDGVFLHEAADEVESRFGGSVKRNYGMFQVVLDKDWTLRWTETDGKVSFLMLLTRR